MGKEKDNLGTRKEQILFDVQKDRYNPKYSFNAHQC